MIPVHTVVGDVTNLHISGSLHLNLAVIHIDNVNGSAVFSVIVETVIHVEIIGVDFCLFPLGVIRREDNEVHVKIFCQIIGHIVQLVFLLGGQKIRFIKDKLLSALSGPELSALPQKED